MCQISLQITTEYRFVPVEGNFIKLPKQANSNMADVATVYVAADVQRAVTYSNNKSQLYNNHLPLAS